MPNRAYLAGPINGCTDDEANGWRTYVKQRLKGWEILDPMGRDYRGSEDDNVEDIVEGDKEDIRKSDVILVNAERASWGTAMELMYAWMIGCPIVAVCSPDRPVSPWLRYHAMIVHSMDEAITTLGEQ